MPKTMPSMWEDITLADVVSNLFVEIATLGIVFFLGAMVGSFVNVILYRMPRRMNLLWPPSRCPACANRLKLVDNVPVVGYLRLRGKCRFCGAAIPRSYLWVEVGFGLLLLATMYLEAHTGGWNLPLRIPNHYIGALWTIWYPQPELLRIVAYHMLLVIALATLYLFARRREQFPGLFVVVALLSGVLLPAWLPGLHQVPWNGLGVRDSNLWRSTGLTEALLGMIGGAAVGAILALLWPVRVAPVECGKARLAIPPCWNVIVVLAVVGAWLGWQAALSVAVLTTALTLVRPRATPTTLAVVAVSVQLSGWRLLTQFAPWWPGPETSWFMALAWVVVATTLLLLARYRNALLPKAERPLPGSVPSPEKRHIARATPEADSAADTETFA